MPCGASARPLSCFTPCRASTRLPLRSTPIPAPPFSGRRTMASLSGWLSWNTCWAIARRLHGHESQSSIIGDPAPLPLQPQPGQFVHPLLDLRTSVGGHGCQQVAAKHAQPIGDAVRAVVQWCRPVEQLHEPHLEAGPLQERAILPDAREVPRVADPFPGNAFLGQRLMNGCDDGRNVPGATHLGDEPPARLKRPGDGRYDCLRWGHPVQRGIGENGIHRRLNREVFPPGNLKPKLRIELPGASDHRFRGVNPYYFCAGRCDLCRQRPGPAPEVDNPLAWPRRHLARFRHFPLTRYPHSPSLIPLWPRKRSECVRPASLITYHPCQHSLPRWLSPAAR